MPELPNIVRERLKASRPTAAHPDADVLTAFSERALPESEGAVVAEHLAGCELPCCAGEWSRPGLPCLLSADFCNTSAGTWRKLSSLPAKPRRQSRRH